jgi:hypothetical protein
MVGTVDSAGTVADASLGLGLIMRLESSLNLG